MGGIPMIKQDHCDCCGSTFIGFSHSYDNGYCKKCGHMFTFHWNGCNPFSENKTCPKCGNHDEVETEHGIESHIDMIKMFMGCDGLFKDKTLSQEENEKRTDDSHKRMRKEINELHRIRREFDKYNEDQNKKRIEDREKEYAEHKKRLNKN